MKKRFVTLIVTGVLVLSCAVTFAGDLPQAFIDGIRAYDAKNYSEAIEDFSQIVDSGVQNGKLFYNLANAYLKNGDTGHAVLWFERALRFMPDEPDLKFNLDYARSLVRDQAEEKENPLLRVAFFWKNLLSRTAIQWIAVVLNLVFWVLMILQLLVRKRSFKFPAAVVLIVAVIFTLTALYQFYESANVRHAVILADEVSVRSGLSADSTELFVLHSGTRVRIDKQMEQHYLIRFSEEKIGWVNISDIGVI
ncbi:MAG: tetratricopeptide repeat protein [Desulfobacterales bacterium]|nr:tetratricopeptide repeat protein [Desulfobacterales bacterium]MDD4391996.1 tetratricopeptide repeat protein [Desulfobacterales bacterium]